MKAQILALPLALLLAIPAHSQTLPQPARPNTGGNGSGEIGSLIVGDKFPLTLKLKDIDTGWRRMSISAALEAPAAARPASPTGMQGSDDFATTLISLFGGGPEVYLTKGLTVKEGGDSFLVAYRVRLDRPAIKAFEESFPKGDSLSLAQAMKIIEMFVQERPLDLSLLNLRMVGRVTDIRPFRYQDQMALFNTRLKTEFSKNVDPNTSMQNLRQLGAALRMYLNKNNEVLPLMTDSGAAKKALMPYAKNESVFFYPSRPDQPYRVNPTLSGKKMGHLTKYAATMVAFYEAAPAPDATRAVLFLDGHTQRVNESEWPQLKKASRIP